MAFRVTDVKWVGTTAVKTYTADTEAELATILTTEQLKVGDNALVIATGNIYLYKQDTNEFKLF